jgi:hypothetical protein
MLSYAWYSRRGRGGVGGFSGGVHNGCGNQIVDYIISYHTHHIAMSIVSDTTTVLDATTVIFSRFFSDLHEVSSIICDIMFSTNNFRIILIKYNNATCAFDNKGYPNFNYALVYAERTTVTLVFHYFSSSV